PRRRGAKAQLEVSGTEAAGASADDRSRRAAAHRELTTVSAARYHFAVGIGILGPVLQLVERAALMFNGPHEPDAVDYARIILHQFPPRPRLIDTHMFQRLPMAGICAREVVARNVAVPLREFAQLL